MSSSTQGRRRVVFRNTDGRRTETLSAAEREACFLLKRMDREERQEAVQKMGRQRYEVLYRSDANLNHLREQDELEDDGRASLLGRGLAASSRLLGRIGGPDESVEKDRSEAFREMAKNKASLAARALHARSEGPVSKRKRVREDERDMQALKRQTKGLEGELRAMEGSDDDEEGEPSKKFKRYYYEDVDERRYLVYDRVEAIKWGAESLYVRRMTNLDRLRKVMSGEGLRLSEDKFKEVLTGRMTEELLGIGKEDPTFVSNLELRRVLILTVMKDQEKFGRLLRGTLHTLADFVVGGRVDDLTQLEQACLGVQNVFAAVFDLRWSHCMDSVLTVIRDAVMRQVTLKFVLVRIEGAWRYFNRIVVGPDRYERNPGEQEHPEELIRVDSVIQLWTSIQAGLLEQCRDPVALIRWYSEFGGGLQAGPSSVDDVERAWSQVGGTAGGGRPPKGKGEKAGEKELDRAKKGKGPRTPKKDKDKKKAKTPDKDKKVDAQPVSPGGGTPTSTTYCVETVKNLLGQSKEGCTRPNCRFLHPATRKDVDGELLKSQTKNVKITSLDSKARRRLLNQLGVKVGAGE